MIQAEQEFTRNWTESTDVVVHVYTLNQKERDERGLDLDEATIGLDLHNVDEDKKLRLVLNASAADDLGGRLIEAAQAAMHKMRMTRKMVS